MGNRGRNYAIAAVAFCVLGTFMYLNLITCFGGWVCGALARKHSEPRTTWRRVGTASYLVSMALFLVWALYESGFLHLRLTP
jgi:hypothetical protein